MAWEDLGAVSILVIVPCGKAKVWDRYPTAVANSSGASLCRDALQGEQQLCSAYLRRLGDPQPFAATYPPS